MPKNILLIQEDSEDAASVRNALVSSNEGPFQVEWVRLCSEGLERLAGDGRQRAERTEGFAAVLLDLFLPDSRGIETFDKIFAAAPQIPILVLIASDDEDVAKLAVQRGAQDFLLKGRLDNYWLPKALRSMVERASNGDALFKERSAPKSRSTPSVTR